MVKKQYKKESEIMPFQIGNDLWKRRKITGRKKIFKSPEQLWKGACEYFEWAKANPWMKNDVVRSGDAVGMELQIPTERPFTLQGLCLFLGINSKYFFEMEANAPEDVRKVIDTIRDVIYCQKYEGAAVGAFNARIIARDLGLTDKKEHSGQIGIVPVTGMEITK